MKKTTTLKKAILTALLLSLAVAGASACQSTPSDSTGPVSDTSASTDTGTPPDDGTKDVYIHKFSELNTKQHAPDSHGSVYTYSHLEESRRDHTTYEGIGALGIPGYYSRVKLLDDGRYMLVFHNSNYGGKVYVAFGKDITSFSTPTEIFGSVQLDGETKLYMTPDAEQMPNGRIMVVCSYRSTSAYSTAIGKNGIAMRYSDDGGKTWSEQKTVYTGTNWEPSLLVTGDNSVNLLFTSTAPTIALYGFEERSGMVGMVSSADNGENWTPNITGAPWKAQIVAQRYLGMDGNIKRMTDQMPVATILNNGTTALALEEQINDRFTLAFAYSKNAFNDVSLDVGESGPSDVKYSIFNGAGPYIRQFASGETVLTYHWANTFRYRLGDTNAKTWKAETTLFTEAGHWGAVEIDGSHSCVMTIGKKTFGLYLTRLYLNHAITASKETPVLDGDGNDWTGDEAWFIGSDSQAQSSVRISYDDEKIYILAERLDTYTDKRDSITVMLDDGTAGGFYSLKINPDGTVEANKYDPDTKRYTKYDASGTVATAVSVCGTLSEHSDKDSGIVYEIAIDKSLTKTADNKLTITVSMQNRDAGSGNLSTDIIDGVELASKNTWIPVTLG